MHVHTCLYGCRGELSIFFGVICLIANLCFPLQMNEAVRNVLRGTHFAPAYTCNCSKALASSYALLKDIFPVLKGMASGTLPPAGRAGLALLL